jgi:exodeoxyribonuclease VII large subunit
VSRKGTPSEEPIWGDWTPDEEAAGETGSREPPSWALPWWDALSASEPRPGTETGGVRPGRGPQASGGETPASGRDPAGPGRDLPVSQGAPSGMSLRILGVTEVTRIVRDAVRAQAGLRDLWVEGEVGRVTVSSAGHAYFTLKDERSQLACVFFRDDRLASPFEPRTGLRVVVHGRVDVFESQGVYQLYVTGIQPAGFGDLALRFEALKAKLAAEGLFESARKRPLPVRPVVVGVATSASGAVWHDICHVLSRRWPLARVVLAPCQVQGEGAAASVVAALDRLARWGQRCREEERPDEAPAVVIVARGGGSLEDLWPFNDERLVRAVAAHPVPVVSGVGHEVDVTLADFAADVRAPTPSAAAELVVPDRADVAAGLAGLLGRAASCAGRAVATSRADVAAEGRALERLRPSALLAQIRERAGHLLDRTTAVVRGVLAGGAGAEQRLSARLGPAIAQSLGARRLAVERASASLTVLGPQATLDRGYAIIRRRADGSIVRSPDEAPRGERLSLRLARGEVGATSEGPDGAAGAAGSRGTEA